nr:uncharacterized protein LOC124818557 [Hydra vulgaris]
MPRIGCYKKWQSGEKSIPRTTRWRLSKLDCAQQKNESTSGENDSIDEDFMSQLSGLDEPENETNSNDFKGNESSESPPLYPGSKINVSNACLCIMTFVLRFNLSYEALEALLSLLTILLPHSLLPTSKYLFLKFFKKEKELYEKVFYCDICEVALSTNKQCTKCLKYFTLSYLYKKCSYFHILKINKQHKNMCDNNWIHLASLEENVQATIRLVVNTDGIPVFKLSKWTLWPLLASIHNFPYSLQITNILFFGFWSSFKKPNVQLLLSCFVDFLLTYPLLVV